MAWSAPASYKDHMQLRCHPHTGSDGHDDQSVPVVDLRLTKESTMSLATLETEQTVAVARGSVELDHDLRAALKRTGYVESASRPRPGWQRVDLFDYVNLVTTFLADFRIKTVYGVDGQEAWTYLRQTRDRTQSWWHAPGPLPRLGCAAVEHLAHEHPDFPAWFHRVVLRTREQAPSFLDLHRVRVCLVAGAIPDDEPDLPGLRAATRSH